MNKIKKLLASTIAVAALVVTTTPAMAFRLSNSRQAASLYSGYVCYAETGRVYLRNSDLSYSANRTLRNGTPIVFTGYGYTPGYVKVYVPSTGQSGYITVRYTCSY